MPNVEYLKADINDYEAVVDLIDLVFSIYSPHDFAKLFPAQYTKNNFMTGTNYIVKEDGKIVANVGTYPAEYYICGKTLKVSGLTSVAVHSRARSKGYMNKLMEMAVSDMRNDGIDFSFLYGLRQRYEYFGYTPCGVRFDYSCNKHNIQHSFGKTLNKDISLKEAEINDIEMFDDIFKKYTDTKVYIKRPRERFPDIMGTWENKTFGIYKSNRFIGYISVSKDYSSICELSIDDPGLLGSVLNTYLEQFKRNDVSVTVFPFEKALIRSLSKFTEYVSVHNDNNFYVIDFLDVIDSFLKLKCETVTIPDGSITFDIKDIGNITISILNNQPSVMFTDEKPDARLDRLEASRLFFSHFSAYSVSPVDDNHFARSLFPLPLFVRKLDRT